MTEQERDCDNCKHYIKCSPDYGIENVWMCEKWECEFEPKDDDIIVKVLERIKSEIKQLPNANPSYWNKCDVVDREEVIDIIDEFEPKEDGGEM